MAMCKSICSVARINFQRWKSDLRIWVLFIFIGLLLVQELRGLTAYGLDIGEKCTGYLLPVLFHSSIISVGTMKTMLYLGCLLLLCDAPFIYPTTPYMVLRSRRETWWMGECLYIFCVTLIFTLFITLISTLVILPISTFGESWGTVAKDFISGSAEMDLVELRNFYSVFLSVPRKTVGYLYPAGAQLYTFFMVWMTFFFLGLVQYLVSLGSKSMFLGFVSAAVFVFLDPILNELSQFRNFRWVQMLSPVCWVSTDSLHVVNEDGFLEISYVIGLILVLIVLLVLAIRMVSKKIVIEVRGEV